jgi:hypothetical protein
LNILRKLLSRLGIDETYLTITDEITGAGYISKNEYVLCRWGYVHEGVAILSAYLDAVSTPNIHA